MRLYFEPLFIFYIFSQCLHQGDSVKGESDKKGNRVEGETVTIKSNSDIPNILSSNLNKKECLVLYKYLSTSSKELHGDDDNDKKQSDSHNRFFKGGLNKIGNKEDCDKTMRNWWTSEQENGIYSFKLRNIVTKGLTKINRTDLIGQVNRQRLDDFETVLDEIMGHQNKTNEGNPRKRESVVNAALIDSDEFAYEILAIIFLVCTGLILIVAQSMIAARSRTVNVSSGNGARP